MLRDEADVADRLESFAGTALALAVEAKDPYTSGHRERVARFAAAITEGLRFAEEHVWRVRTAGVLHDVGKLAVPDAILNSEDALSDEQYDAIKSHSTAGELLVARAGMPPRSPRGPCGAQRTNVADAGFIPAPTPTGFGQSTGGSRRR